MADKLPLIPGLGQQKVLSLGQLLQFCRHGLGVETGKRDGDDQPPVPPPD
jgi:hypothetical protein